MINIRHNDSRTALENRIFAARTEAYKPVVKAIVELRDYGRRMNLKTFGEEEPNTVPVLEDGRWLALLALVELFASEQVRSSFEVLPGRVSAFREGLLDATEAVKPSTTVDERQAAWEFQKKQRAALEERCEKSLVAIRQELAG